MVTLRLRQACEVIFHFSVALASIPELPAETCKEIKESEFGQAVNGKYWFSGIKPGMAVLAHCDMETEGALGVMRPVMSTLLISGLSSPEMSTR